MRDQVEFSRHANETILDLDECAARLRRKRLAIDEAMIICARLARLRLAVQYALGHRSGNFSTHPKDDYLP